VQSQILGNLDFSGYAVPLYITTAMFRKNILTGSETWWKLDFQAWIFRIVYYTSWFSS